MKKIIFYILFFLISPILFAENLTSVMGINFGASLKEAEQILSEKGWFSTSATSSEDNFGKQKKYEGGVYGGIAGLEMQLYFLKEEDKTSLYKIELRNSESYSGDSYSSLKIEYTSKFSDVLEALLSKYDWKTIEGSEKIRDFKYTKSKPTEKITYIDKQNSSIVFVRTESRYAIPGFYSRSLNECLTFTFAPLNEVYEKNLKKEQQRLSELKQKEKEEKEKLRLKQIDSLKKDL